MTKALFRKKSACCGTVVASRWAVVMSGFAKSKIRNKASKLLRSTDSIYRAAIGVRLPVRCPAIEQLDRTTPEGRIKIARDKQERIPHRFEVESAAVRFRQQAVVRIQLLMAKVVIALLLVDAGKHQQAVQFLERPAVLHKPPSEVVQQFGMARWIGAQPKIVGSRHQTGAKMMEPEAVNYHPGREGILPAGDGSGQLKSAAAMGERLPFVPRQDRKKLAGSLLTQSIRVPTDEDSAVLRPRTVHERHGALGSAGMAGVKARYFSAERSDPHERRYVIESPDQLGRQVTGAVLAVEHLA